MSTRSRNPLSFRCLLALFASALAAQSAQAVGDVVISQVWGGPSSATGTAGLPRADYVELHNRTGSAINMSGWSLNIATTTGTTWSKLDLPTGPIPANGYFLVRVSADATNGTDLPTPDAAFGTLSYTVLSSTSGKVCLRDTTTAIGALNCPSTNIIDLVTYGTTGTCFEGTGRAPGGSTSGSGSAPFRRGDGCLDSDDNTADFTTMIPNPRNSASPPTSGCVTGACCDPITGACVLDTNANCGGAGSNYIGDGTSCSANTCDPSGACCNGTTGSTCTAPRTASGCAALTNGVYIGNGTTCSPTPCTTGACCIDSGAGGTCCTTVFSGVCINQGGVASPAGVTCTTLGNCIPPAANDLCANAITVSAGTLYVGSNFAATDTGDGPNPTSETTKTNNKGVWYKFTPSVTSVFDVSACGTVFDSTMQIFRIPNCTDLSTWSYVACDDDKCAGGATEPGECAVNGSGLAPLILGVALEAGQTYYIRVNAYTTATTGGGNYHLLVTDVGGAFGACCISTTGECMLRSGTGCTTNDPAGIYAGDGTTCTTNPCTVVVGACCFSGGVCVPRQQSACTGTNVYNGDGSTCFPSPCETGACCSSTGVCTVTGPNNCTASGTAYLGADTVCSPDPCPKGACCNASTGACTITAPSSQGGCSTGTFQTVGSVCTAGSNPCVPANDECTGAIALSEGVSVNSSTYGATQSANATLCSSGLDVFFSFTPASTGTYRVLLTPSTTSLSLAVGTICPTFDDNVACITSSTTPRNTGPITLTGGTTYYIRPGISGTTASGASFDLVVNATATGACCNNTTGVCTVAAAIDGCGTTGTYQGDNSACTASTCPVGACCNLTSGACTITAPPSTGGCSTGTYQGDDTTCMVGTCPAQGICCNQCTLACTVTVESGCDTGTSTWDGGATACTPSNICRTYGAAPANDGACGAIPLSLGVTTTGSMKGATDTDDGGTVSGCGTTGTPGPALWYSFQPATTGYYELTTCGTTFDNTMAVLTGACNDVANMTVVACDDDSCNGGSAEPVVCGTGVSSSLGAVISFVWLDQSTSYFVRVRAYTSTTTGGTFPLTINTTIAGACCSTAGACTTTTQAGCTGTSLFLGNATACGVDPCPATGSCCNNCTYACTLGFEAACNTGTSTWTVGGSCTTGSITCIQGAAPANDLATGAIALTSGNAVTGTLFTATSTDDGPQSTCDAVASKGVWYSFSPPSTGDYSLGTCGSTFANVLTVLTGDPNVPSSMAIVACDDDTCLGTETAACGTGSGSTAAALIPVLTLTQGTTYYLRVQVDGATATGAGTFSVSVIPAVSGACCANGGACTDTIASLCTGGSLFFSGQTCGSGPCANVGACCNTTTLACSLSLAASCTGGSSQFQGAGVSCTSPNPCLTNDECPGPNLPLATFYFATNVGATPGAGTSPSCSISGCEDTWWDFTAPFTDTFRFHCVQLNSGQPVISLWPDCSLTGELACLSGGRESPVTPDITLAYAMTAGQNIKVRISAYACAENAYTLEVNSTLPSGACCTGPTCAVQLASACSAGYQGDNSVCTPTTCAQPGVCCRGATCSTAFADAAACAAALDSTSAAVASKFVTAAACNTPATTPGMLGNTTSPCCYANFNHNATLEVQDIFDFLNDWFAGKKSALVGGDGTTGTLSVQNIFDFLNAWFAGGCT